MNVCDPWNQPINQGTKALIRAAKNDHCKCVKLLIEAGVRVNGEDDFGNTALNQAAGNGCEKCVSLHISANAQVNWVSNKGKYDSNPCCSKNGSYQMCENIG